MQDLLTPALRDVATCVPGTAAYWDRLVRQARHANLLGRLGALLQARGLLHQVPEAPRRHLLGMLTLSQAQQDEVRRELRYAAPAVAEAGAPLVLLKGAAYVMTGLPPAAGRMFSDTDILVPKARLLAVESGLLQRGWAGGVLTAYDQNYYRAWMHELPPLTHSRRGTTLDVHHNILPGTARIRVNADALFQRMVAVPGHDGLYTLCPADMVLHAASHLIHNDDLSHGLRDLSDIHLLLGHFGQQPGFWADLLRRAETLGLARPLHYTLAAAGALLGTAVPPDLRRSLQQAAAAAPLDAAMQALWRRALGSQHPAIVGPGQHLTLFALYLRAHWLRMPPLMLARHLSIKAWQRATTPAAAADGPKVV